jgi:hypothetical protein
MVGFTGELPAPPSATSATGELAENGLASPEERGLAKEPDLKHAIDPVRNMMMMGADEAKSDTDLLPICWV